MPYDAQDGRMDDPSGPSASLASLSARRAKEQGLLTSGTYAPRPIISSASADLMSALASRLRARTASLGSTLYRLTWKARVTPAGRSISALRASAVRISAKDCSLSGYATPAAHEPGGTPEQFLARRQKAINAGSKMGLVVSALSLQVALAGYASPAAADAERDGKYLRQMTIDAWARGSSKGLSLPHAAHLAGYPIVKATDGRGGRTTAMKGGGNAHLDRTVRLAGYPTTARDWRSDRSKISSEELYGSKGQPLARTSLYADSGQELTGSGTETASTGQLRPGHSRWLQALPVEWDDYAPTAIRSTRKSPRSSSKKP